MIAIACVTFDLSDGERADQFGHFLESLKQLPVADSAFRLFVVDSLASEVTTQLLRERCPFPYWYHPSAENTGYGGGNAIALERIVSEGIKRALFCNPDILLFKNAVVDLDTALNSSPDNAIAFGRYLDRSGVVVPFLDARFSFRRILTRKLLHRPTESSPLLTGCCFFADVVKFTAAGGFPTNFFLYGEEVEMHRRIVKAGCAAGVVQTMTCQHHNGRNDADILDPTWGMAKANSFRLLVTGKDPMRLAYPLMAAIDGLLSHRFRGRASKITEAQQVFRALRWFYSLCRRISRNPSERFTSADLLSFSHKH